MSVVPQASRKDWSPKRRIIDGRPELVTAQITAARAKT
jgi:hypothetical protein